MRRVLFLVIIGAGLLTARAVVAQAPAADPGKIRALTDLLRDPAIQSWLQGQAESMKTASGAETPASGGSVQQIISGRLDAMRGFLRDLVAAVPALPGEMRRAWTVLSSEIRERGAVGVVVLLALFVALGLGLERLFWWATDKFRQRVIAAALDSVHDRLRAVWVRFVYGVGMVLAFALGSIGAFLLFDWPPLLRQTVLSYLLVFLVVRLTLVLGRIILAPGAERFRTLPMATATARFWFVWTPIIVGYYVFVRVTLDLLTGQRGGSVCLNRFSGFYKWNVCRVQAAAICGSRLK